MVTIEKTSLTTKSAKFIGVPYKAIPEYGTFVPPSLDKDSNGTFRAQYCIGFTLPIRIGDCGDYVVVGRSVDAQTG
jgi:hypothetical protein